LPRAYELARQCSLLAQHLQDQALLQEAHLTLGSTLLHMGEHATARAALEAGIRRYDRRQSRVAARNRGTAPDVVCLSRLAWTLWMLGYAEQALARSHEALALAHETSHTYSLVFALHFSGLLHQCRREPHVVQERAEEEMALSSTHGFVEWCAGAQMLRGWAVAAQGAPQEGILQLRQGLDAWLAKGNELGKTQVLARLAEACGQAGKIAAGLRVLTEALGAVEANGERHYATELHRLRGELLLQSRVQRLDHQGKPVHVARAAVCFQRALDMARQQQAKALELRATMSLARLWQTQGKRADAYQLLTAIYDWFTEGFDTPDLQEAEALLTTLQ
jgi:adenylate cyclase